jgi:hypothetical protein
VDCPEENGIRRLEPQQVAVRASLPPRRQFLEGSFPQAERYSQSRLLLDASDDVRHPWRGDARILSRLEDDRSVFEANRSLYAIDDLFGRHPVPGQSGVPGADAAVKALPDAVVGNLDESSEVDGVAYAGMPGLVSPFPEAVENLFVLFPEPAGYLRGPDPMAFLRSPDLCMKIILCTV